MDCDLTCTDTILGEDGSLNQTWFCPAPEHGPACPSGQASCLSYARGTCLSITKSCHGTCPKGLTPDCYGGCKRRRWFYICDDECFLVSEPCHGRCLQDSGLYYCGGKCIPKNVPCDGNRCPDDMALCPSTGSCFKIRPRCIQLLDSII